MIELSWKGLAWNKIIPSSLSTISAVIASPVDFMSVYSGFWSVSSLYLVPLHKSQGAGYPLAVCS